MLLTSKASVPPCCAVAPVVWLIAESAKSSVSFEVLVSVQVVAAAVWPGETVVVAPTFTSVMLTLRSTTTLVDTDCAVCEMPPTWKFRLAVLVMVLPASVPAETVVPPV